SRSTISAPTNIRAASLPTLQPKTPAMFRWRCSVPAMYAATTAATATAGARTRCGKRKEPRFCAALRPGVACKGSTRHDDGRADGNALVEIGNIVVQHADAAIGDEAADRTRHVGAVDGIFAAGERHGGDAHRIARRTSGDHVGHLRLVALDFLRR